MGSFPCSRATATASPNNKLQRSAHCCVVLSCLCVCLCLCESFGILRRCRAADFEFAEIMQQWFPYFAACSVLYFPVIFSLKQIMFVSLYPSIVARSFKLHCFSL